MRRECMRSRQTSRAYGPATPDHLHYWLGDTPARVANGPRDGLPALVIASRRSTSAATLPTSSTKISRNWPGRRQRLRAAPAGIRPMGPRSGHGRRSRRAADPPGSGQPAGKYRDRGWSRVRNVIDHRRPGRGCLDHDRTGAGGHRSTSRRGRPLGQPLPVSGSTASCRRRCPGRDRPRAGRCRP
jgi:hypothetical protein